MYTSVSLQGILTKIRNISGVSRGCYIHPAYLVCFDVIAVNSLLFIGALV